MTATFTPKQIEALYASRLWNVELGKGLMFLEDLGEVPEALKEKLFAEKNAKKLNHWIKLAAKCQSIDEFVKKADVKGYERK